MRLNKKQDVARTLISFNRFIDMWPTALEFLPYKTICYVSGTHTNTLVIKWSKLVADDRELLLSQRLNWELLLSQRFTESQRQLKDIKNYLTSKIHPHFVEPILDL